MGGRCVREDEVALLKANGLNPGFLKKPTPELKLKIASEYREGASSHHLASSYGVCVKSILKWIRDTGEPVRTMSQAGLKRVPSKRTYALNEAVFDQIDEHSAYWVGFLMADGNVRSRRHGQKVLSIGLGERDEGHLRKFASFLETERPVALRSSQTRRDGSPLIEARFEISSNRICDALASHGVVPKKSATAKAVGLEMNRDFWRGVIDGDGCLSTPRGTPSIVLCGSEPLTRQFFKFCESLGIDPPRTAHYPMKGSLWIVRLHAKRAANTVAALYGESSVFLDRKKDIADRIMGSARSS